MKFRLPVPRNWQDFEDICFSLWRDIWMDPYAQKNGREGQSQDGVDIFGQPYLRREYHGVQCKLKGRGRGRGLLSYAALYSGAQKAKSFKPALSSFTVATTSLRDADLQLYCRDINESRVLPFDVHVWSWDDIEIEVCCRKGDFRDILSFLCG